MHITTTHNNRTYPRWLITVQIAGLNMIGPFSTDTYFPAFAAIGRDLQASALQTQQTLSLYLAGFAVMQLFHGALSDAYGRRPVILIALGLFVLSAMGCALSTNIHMLIVCRLLQGLCAGSGSVVGRAMIRDLFDNVAAQKMMSQVSLIFGAAPAIAPIIGGWLYVLFGWQSVFVFMALAGLILLGTCLVHLPESLPHAARNSFRFGPLVRGYRAVLASHHFMLMALALGFNFSAFFLYIASAPAFIQTMLGLGPTQFAWLFLPCITGIMTGASISGFAAGRLTPERTVLVGYAIMGAAVVANLLYVHAVSPIAVPWAIVPLALYGVGMALIMPSITLIVLDLFPHMRGMASSLQGFISTLFMSLAAGLVAPLLAISDRMLAIGMAALYGMGALCWGCYRLIHAWERRRAQMDIPAAADPSRVA